MKHGHPNPTEHTSHPHKKDGESSLRLVAWETTRNCNLNCIHCRASATSGADMILTYFAIEAAKTLRSEF